MCVYYISKSRFFHSKSALDLRTTCRIHFVYIFYTYVYNINIYLYYIWRHTALAIGTKLLTTIGLQLAQYWHSNIINNTRFCLSPRSILHTRFATFSVLFFATARGIDRLNCPDNQFPISGNYKFTRQMYKLIPRCSSRIVHHYVISFLQFGTKGSRVDQSEFASLRS